MKRVFLLILSLTTTSVIFGQSKMPVPFLSFGIDHRLYPIDIENAPRGPSLGDNGLPSDDSKFWQPYSIHSQYSLQTQKNWAFSASLYVRYNLLHRTENVNFTSASPTVLGPPTRNPNKKKNLKFDFFIDAEKKIRIQKNKEQYISIKGGAGFTNINSRFDVILTDSLDSRPFDTKHYKGNFLHFGPRLSIGYQYNKMKASIDGYIIEDPMLANLTSLWLGATLSYEIKLKKKKS